MKRKAFFVLSFAGILFASCATINTSKEAIKDSKFIVNRQTKENIIEFPTIHYIDVSKSEKRLFNTADVPHIMNVSYLVKVIIAPNNQKLFILQCAFSARAIKNQPFRIEKIFNKEEQLLKVSYDGVSQTGLSFDWQPSFTNFVKGNVDIDNNPLLFFDDAQNPQSYNTNTYSINYDLDAPTTVYYSIPISREYLVKHKDDGIVLKAYSRGKYGRIFFHIAPFYIQAVLEKSEATNYSY
ncbi:MAG: hypothetical protein LBV16_04825 [Elusimicrobiota bacterium]|jgi:hypothetical protein|nr:hypothetical protein [Elusimicrobiota bacterium]